MQSAISGNVAGQPVLRRVTEAIRVAIGAEQTWVAQRTGERGQLEVLASAGAGAPAPLTRLADIEPCAGRMILPLLLNEVEVGSVVADGIVQGSAAHMQRELSLLTDVISLAVQNHRLLQESAHGAARQAQHHFRLLSGTIYHLKNTLANASEYIELLELEGELNEAQREYMERSRRSTHRALRLLSELHELGRTDAGELVPHLEPLNVESLLRDVLRDYHLSAGTTTVEFVVEVDELPLLRTDPDCVRQIMDNLLSNAVRYSPAGGRITVRASLHGGRRADDPAIWLRIDVIDEGPGISPTDDVFEEVQRVEKKGPPGFRLAISRRIARLLGGDLALHSAEGAGSTFSLWLPHDG